MICNGKHTLIPPIIHSLLRLIFTFFLIDKMAQFVMQRFLFEITLMLKFMFFLI